MLNYKINARTRSIQTPAPFFVWNIYLCKNVQVSFSDSWDCGDYTKIHRNFTKRFIFWTDVKVIQSVQNGLKNWHLDTHHQGQQRVASLFLTVWKRQILPTLKHRENHYSLLQWNCKNSRNWWQTFQGDFIFKSRILFSIKKTWLISRIFVSIHYYQTFAEKYQDFRKNNILIINDDMHLRSQF